MLDETLPQPLCVTGDEWERIELTVDSGAAETICPAAVAKNVPTVPGEKYKACASYTCASCKPLPNRGVKRCLAYFSDSGTARGLRMQVADINRPCLSVSRAVEDRVSGERTSIERRGELYVMESWVKAKGDDTADQDKGKSSPFGGPGAKP